MTMTTLCRRITLHLSQIFLTLGWTFIALSWCRAGCPGGAVRASRSSVTERDRVTIAAAAPIDYL
jgi:hypothetical protein